MSMILLAIIYVAFIGLGLTDPVLGTAWPVMQPEFGAALELAGVIAMLVTGMKVLFSLVTERFTRRFGAGVTTMTSMALMAAALFGCSRATAVWQLCLWACVQGIGAGVIDTGLNDYVSLHYTSKYMSWLHCFWGVGSSISPLIMGVFLNRNNNWQGGYRSVSALLLAITVLLFVTLRRWNNQAGDISQREKKAGISLTRTLQIPGVPSILLVMLCCCSAEVTVELWASSYLVEAGRMDADLAAKYAALVFIGVTTGRFLGGFVADRWGDIRLSVVGTVIAICGSALLLFPQQPLIVGMGLLLVGIGCGPAFPSMIHAAPIRFGAECASSVIAMQMSSANVGSALMPLLFGVLARSVSIWLMPAYLVAFFLLALLFMRRLTHTAK